MPVLRFLFRLQKDSLTMLKVYSASAGSGKTFRLAKEYILLLFGNRYAYRNILAVTFTNKATEEMKERILYSLYVLSSNPSSSPYYADVAAIAGRENVAAQARMILESLMNDYGGKQRADGQFRDIPSEKDHRPSVGKHETEFPAILYDFIPVSFGYLF